MATGKFIAYYRVSTARQGSNGLGLKVQRYTALLLPYADGKVDSVTEKLA
jgi:hypothetical protein